MSASKYVAIVDDHIIFRQGLEYLICRTDPYKVLFGADNGKDFIAKLKPSALPDIVVLDVSMPEMDGYATAKWIRANYPTIKILAISMLDNEASIVRMVKHGARGYILKDANADELRLAFSEILEKGFYYNERISRKLLHAMNAIIHDDDAGGAFTDLTDRETDFIRLACSERSYKQIASEMLVSERTVDGYRDALFRKLNISTRVGLAIYAIRNGLVSI